MDAIFLVVAQWWGVVQHYSGWRAFERYVNKYNGLGTVLAALISAAVVFWIAQRYTKRIKQIDSTLEFSSRFHELMQQRVDLNKAYLERRKWENWPPNALETEAAEAW